MRLIDADTVVTIQTYDDMYEEWGSETMTLAEAMDKFSDEGCPPTVDAQEVRHGVWIAEHDRHIDGECITCSVCDEEWITQDMSVIDLGWKYCPNCGAKMDGGKQDA